MFFVLFLYRFIHASVRLTLLPAIHPSIYTRKSTAPATKKQVQVIRNAAPVTKKHLGIADDLIRQNATPLRKSGPWAPNISAEDASCTAPATKNASVQIRFKSPTPAIVFENATKPSRFSHFSVDAQSTPPATKWRLNVQNVSETLSF